MTRIKFLQITKRSASNEMWNATTDNKVYGKDNRC